MHYVANYVLFRFVYVVMGLFPISIKDWHLAEMKTKTSGHHIIDLESWGYLLLLSLLCH